MLARLSHLNEINLNLYLFEYYSILFNTILYSFFASQILQTVKNLSLKRLCFPSQCDNKFFWYYVSTIVFTTSRSVSNETQFTSRQYSGQLYNSLNIITFHDKVGETMTPEQNRMSKTIEIAHNYFGALLLLNHFAS